MTVSEIIQLISMIIGGGAISTFMTLLITSRLRKAQRQKLESDVTETTSKIYSSMVKDLNDQLQDYKKRYGELVEEFERDQKRLKSEIKELKIINEELKEELDFMKKTNHPVR